MTFPWCRYILTALLTVMATVGSRAASTNLPIMAGSASAPFTAQKINYITHRESPLPEDWIRKNYAERYFVTSAAYTALGWVIIMSKTSEWEDQIIFTEEKWPVDKIEKLSRAGYYITSIAGDNDKWLIALSKGSGITMQATATMRLDDELISYIADCMAQGYWITAVASKNGAWNVVMSATGRYDNQQFITSSRMEKVQADCEELAAEGFILTASAYNHTTGTWMCVMSHPVDQSATQGYEMVFGVDDPKTVARGIRASGKFITFVGG